MRRSEMLAKAEKLLRAKKLDRAAEAYREHIEAFPKDMDVRRRLAELLTEMGNADGAISEYVKLQELLVASGHVLGAIAAGKKVTEIDPSFNNPLSYVAKVQTDNLEEERRRGAETVPELEPVSEPEPAPGPERDSELGPVRPLSEVPLLADLRPVELQTVADSMIVHDKQEGESIFDEGDAGDSLYFVTRGLVEVSSGSQKLGRLGPGECFGEFSFLTGQARIASVRALQPTELLELSSVAMRGVAETHPRLRNVLFKMYRERAMLNVLARSPLFEMLGDADREKVAGLMELVELDAGDVVIQRGAAEAAVYLIKQGKLEIRGVTAAGEELKLAVLGPHQFFGEVSFLTGVPRTATVAALEETELLKLPEEELRRLVRDYPDLQTVLRQFHLDRVMATAETLKAFLKSDRVEGILS